MTLDRTADAAAVTVTLDQQRWFPLDPGNPGGVQMATLWGDPRRGPFGALLKVPAGFVSPMHRHSQRRAGGGAPGRLGPLDQGRVARERAADDHRGRHADAGGGRPRQRGHRGRGLPRARHHGGAVRLRAGRRRSLTDRPPPAPVARARPPSVVGSARGRQRRRSGATCASRRVFGFGGHRPLHRDQRARLDPPGRADRPGPAGGRAPGGGRARGAGPALPAGRRPPLLRPDLLPRPGPHGQADRAGGPGRVGGVRHPPPDPAGLRALLHRQLPGGGVARPLVRGRGHPGHRAARARVRALAGQLAHRGRGGGPAGRPRGLRQPRLRGLLLVRPGGPVRLPGVLQQRHGRLPGLRPRHLLLRRDPVRADRQRRRTGRGRSACSRPSASSPSSGA